MSAQPTATAGDTVPGRLAAPLERLASGPIARLVREVQRHVPADAPSDASDLNAIGAPIEVGFAWPHDTVRVTVDPCPLATSEARAQACLRAAVDTLTPQQHGVVDQVGDWRRRGAARFGGWLGLRMRDAQVSRKLYLDVPTDAPWRAWEEALVGRPSVLPGRAIAPTMLGLDGDRGGTEIYYRCGGLFSSELDTLLTRFGLAPRGAEIVRMIEAVMQRTVRFTLPSADMGFSCALDAAGHALAFTWYSTSRALVGPPARAREAILRIGRAAGWDLDAYAALTTGPDAPHHGLIGMTLPREGPMQLNATVAALPPAPEAATGTHGHD